ncbi:MAG: SUMF1/EgtB/PvdO family nonheme iron enzyme [Acidobacteriota bacterium]|nr:SUMF1/EgtB/PvdO family nonheme iron enzyme [Acidobacteriota bacterium]
MRRAWLCAGAVGRSSKPADVVILDACRNNPYARSFRSDARGLAGVRNAPSGTLIAYATAADDVASDGGGRNGLFTGELLAQLKTPGLTLERVFRLTRTNVRSKSQGKQVPYEYSSVEGEDFYFIPPNAPPPAVSAEQQAWERVKQLRSMDAVRGYLSLYPNSPFEKEARDLLAALIKENPTVAANPPAASTSALTPIIPLPRGVAPTALSIHRFTTASVDPKGKVTKFDGTPTQQYSEDLGGGVRLEMVAVKGGTFSMGSAKGSSDEKPVHQVTVGNFWMGKFELTQAQWRAVMGTDSSKFKGDNLPVETVSWNEAKEFCRKLNEKLGLKDDEGYRLPTEVEWEFAARAGSKTEFAFGDTINPEIVNYNGKYPTGGAPKGLDRQKTVGVGSLGAANGWGLFDMHGNVWEWCEDWYGAYPAGAITDPKGASSGSYRVRRGGGWNSLAVYCRSALRGYDAPDNRSVNLGFRLVRIGR